MCYAGAASLNGHSLCQRIVLGGGLKCPLLSQSRQDAGGIFDMFKVPGEGEKKLDKG